MMKDETDKYIKDIWEEHFYMEVAHLKKAAELLKKYEKKNIDKLIPNPEFPKLLSFKGNKSYVREVLKTVGYTCDKENYVLAKDLPKDARFFKHLSDINGDDKNVASHIVIEKYIKRFSKDYRYEDKPHPIKPLQDHSTDNTTQGKI